MLTKSERVLLAIAIAVMAALIGSHLIIGS